MSSFLASQSQLRRGKWTAEEEVYAACIMEAFKEGSLNEVEEGVSLRGYLGLKLRTNVKRISKKYEGTNYHGKRLYMKKTHLSKDVVCARRAKLKELELNFEKSVKLMADAESAKKDMCFHAQQAIMPSFPSSFSNARRAPCLFPRTSLATQAAFVSRDVMDENRRILAHHQSVVNSRRTYAGNYNSLNMASSGGSLTSFEIQALMGGMPSAPPSPRTITSAAGLSASAAVSDTMLNRMLIQQQYDAIEAEIMARKEAEVQQQYDAIEAEIMARKEAEAAQFLYSRLPRASTAATRVMEQRAPSSPGSRMALKRPPQLGSYLVSPSKRVKLF